MEAVDVRGRFVWHQLATRDVAGARKFYSKLVGWKIKPWEHDPAFTICHADSGPVAGIMAIPAEAPAEMPAHWLQYIGTRDVDATADAAVRAGGSVIKSPSDMQGAGRYAVLKDPQGAMFAIISPENAPPAEAAGMPAMGTFSWHELATSDNEAAFAFYSGLFGWDAINRMDMGPMGVYLIFGSNGQQRGGMYVKPPDAPMPPSWMPYAFVPSADSGFAWATANGGREMLKPMEVPGGSRIAAIMDPAGAAFAINSPAPAAAEATVQKAAPKSKAKAKTKATPKARAAKKPAARKPVASKKVVKKTARKAARKSAGAAARKSTRRAPMKKAKKGARRKK